MVITFVVGALAIAFGLLQLFDRQHFSEWLRRGLPAGLREQVSEEQTRTVPKLGGLMFILFGVLLGLLGFVLEPGAS